MTTDMKLSLRCIAPALPLLLALSAVISFSTGVKATTRNRFTVSSASRTEDLIVYTPRGYEEEENSDKQYALILLLHPVQDTRIVRIYMFTLPTPKVRACVCTVRRRRDTCSLN